jgi:hypothetical protein
MFLKFLIVVLLFALIASLGAGFYYLMVDQGSIRKRRLFNSLGLRLSIAVTLMALILYGVASGRLSSNAPWEKHSYAEKSAAKPAGDDGPARRAEP